MNDENLKALTPSEAREMGRKGGIASGIARREKKQFREAAQAILNMPISKGAIDGYESLESAVNSNVSVLEGIIIKQTSKALNGDTAAARFLLEVSGETQLQKNDVPDRSKLEEAANEIEIMVMQYNQRKESLGYDD